MGDDKNKRFDVKGKLSEQREFMAEWARKSDWLQRVRELKRWEMLRFVRLATPPNEGLLLYHDGKFQGYYSTTRRLDASAVIFNEYLVFEFRTDRQRLHFEFKDLPVADAPHYTTQMDVDMSVDLVRPELLVEKGIVRIDDTVADYIKPLVYGISGRYKAVAHLECASEVMQKLQVQEYDFGVAVVNGTVSVKRHLPKEILKVIERKEKEEEEARERARKDEEAQRRRDQEAKEEQHNFNREINRLRLTKARQQLYIEQLGNGNFEALMALAAAEKDPETREQLEKLVAGAIARDDVRHQRELEAGTRQLEQDQRDFENRMEVARLMHDQTMEKMELLKDAELLRPEFILNDPGSRQIVNNILENAAPNTTAQSFDLKITKPDRAASARPAISAEDRPKLGQGQRRFDEDDEDEAHEGDVVDDKGKKPDLDDAED